MNFVALSHLIPIVIIQHSGCSPSSFRFNFGFHKLRDGGARGGLACLWRRWFLSILRTISALKGETSPFTEHLFPRTGVKSKLGVTDRKSAKDTASIWHRTPPPPSFSRYEFMDYGDVVMPRRLNCRRSPRLNHPS